MDSDVMRVDGNAMAGVLSEVFVHEMTTARIACGGCGEVEQIGAEHAYMQAPGIVMRCCHCENVLLVVTPAREKYLLGPGRARWIEIEATH